jgi:hypothetical protein
LSYLSHVLSYLRTRKPSLLASAGGAVPRTSMSDISIHPIASKKEIAALKKAGRVEDTGEFRERQNVVRQTVTVTAHYRGNGNGSETDRIEADTAVGDLIAAANAVDIGELVTALRELDGHRLGRAEARAELEAERSKGFWQKLFGG